MISGLEDSLTEHCRLKIWMELTRLNKNVATSNDYYNHLKQFKEVNSYQKLWM